MAIRNLTLREMGGLARQWTGADADAVRALDTGARLLEFLRGFLTLVAAHTAPDSPLIRQLDALLQAADALHDRLVRGLYLVLSGLIELADTEEEAQGYTTLRDRLFPEGVAIVNRSWIEEGDAADGVFERLDESDRARLQGTLPGGRTLLSIVERYRVAGRTLLEKDPERATARGNQQRLDRTTLLQLRNQFIQAIAHMRTTIQFQPDLDPALITRLTAKLDELERLADTRAARRRASGLTEVPEETEPPPVD